MSETLSREALLERIKKLSDRTVENGCTEQEAASAADLLGRLLDRYGFSQEDLKEKLERIAETTVFGKNQKLGPVTWVAQSIAEYTDCKVWQMTVRSPSGAVSKNTLVYLGRETDAAVAMYLTHLIATAMEGEWESSQGHRQRKDFGKSYRSQKRHFQEGMAWRLTERLRAMKQTRSARVDPETKRTGQELVIVKNAQVEAAFAQRSKEIALKDGRTRQRTITEQHKSGFKAADNVAINPGVGTNSDVKRLATA